MVTVNSDKQPAMSSNTTESEIVTDAASIVRLLERLASRHTPITVHIPGRNEYYSSCAVSVEKPYVLLDELMPNTGHKRLLEARALKVACKLDGVDVRFEVTLDRVDEKDELLTYYMDLPASVEYRQRRREYRIQIPLSMKLNVFVDNQTDSPIEGELHDISNGGAGLIFPKMDVALESGSIYESAIELPDGDCLFCSIEIRYSKNIQTRNRQLCGAQFMDLYTPQKRLIGRTIVELEREFLRKRAELNR